MAEVVVYHLEEAPMEHTFQDGFCRNRYEFVALAQTAVGRDRLEGDLDSIGEELDAEVEDFPLVLEIEIEDGTRYTAALGDLLEGGILEALGDEDVEGLFEYFTLPFVVFDGN
jgi:hypothetical protein